MQRLDGRCLILKSVKRDAARQRRLLRCLMNIRLPGEASREFLEVQDAYLREETTRKEVTDLKDLAPVSEGIYLWQGDITTLRCHCQCGEQRDDGLLRPVPRLH